MIKFPPESAHSGAFPVAVGGVGGSGTRVVASMLRLLGYHLGNDLNAAADNLWFTLLFKRPSAIALEDASLSEMFEVFESAMAGQAPHQGAEPDLRRLVDRECPQHSKEWYGMRASSLRQALRAEHGQTHPRTWAWKEPNTHFLAGRLLALRPMLRYVHVSRCGKDMAFSGNQNQLRLWGPTLMPDWDGSTDPSSSLRFWALCQSRVLGSAFARFPERCYWVDFDHLCDAPELEVRRLMTFLEIQATDDLVATLAATVQPPASRGRHTHAADQFTPPATQAYEAYRRFLTAIAPAGAMNR